MIHGSTIARWNSVTVRISKPVPFCNYGAAANCVANAVASVAVKAVIPGVAGSAIAKVDTIDTPNYGRLVDTDASAVRMDLVISDDRCCSTG